MPAGLDCEPDEDHHMLDCKSLGNVDKRNISLLDAMAFFGIAELLGIRIRRTLGSPHIPRLWRAFCSDFYPNRFSSEIIMNQQDVQYIIVMKAVYLCNHNLLF